jgi:hypothetical protein
MALFDHRAPGLVGLAAWTSACTSYRRPACVILALELITSRRTSASR